MRTETLTPVFAALGDDTRWAILARLGEAPASASALAREFPISRQAIVKHLELLTAAGLVESERVGRELVHPKFGEFRLLTLELDPPRYASFRWVDNVAPEAGTLIEFWVEERDGGGVTLKVAESGFTGLQKDHDQIAHQVEENTHGWEVELEAAKRFVLGSVGTA